MIAKLRRLFTYDPDYPRLALETGEEILMEGPVTWAGGLFGGAARRLTVTNKRLFWQQTEAFIWPNKREFGQIVLADIASVDSGNFLDLILGLGRQRLRLR